MNYGVEIPERRVQGWAVWAVVAALLVAALVVLGFTFMRLGMRVTVDGHTVRIPYGTTVGGLRSRGLVLGENGDLVAVTGGVLARGKGASATVSVDGRISADTTQLHGGDVVISSKGRPTVEKIVTVKQPIDPPVDYVGSGPLYTVINPGKPGVAVVQMGAMSKSVVASHVIEKPIAAIARRRDARPGEKIIALTFDDGPWPKQTEAVLSILKKNNVVATFFEIGAQAKGRPYLTRAVLAAGMEIGNHTFKHLILTKVSAAQVKTQILRGEQTITKAGHVRPTIFRPPGGEMNGAVVAEARREGLRIVMWDIDPNDWRKPPVATIVRRVIGQAKPGAIVLMHDGGGDRSHTIAALPKIIHLLKKKGYTFVTIDELFAVKSAK